MLPKSKDEFPKCLCLDQNKWINLACAHYGRPEGKPFNEALTAARAAVEAGKLVIPFSWITAIETIAAADAGRRERLATFLIELSANHTILPESEVCPVEIKNAIAQLFGRATTTIIRPLLIEEGFSHALGLDLKTMGPLAGGAAVLRHVHSPEATAAFLLAVGAKRESIQQRRAAEARAVRVLEMVRSQAASLSSEQRRVITFSAMFSKVGTHGPDLASALEELGLSFEDFCTQVGSAEDIMRFAPEVPNLDVLVTLTLARNQDRDHAIHRNDLRDLDWLSVAVPYSNVVVSENYWGHQVRATRLDAKYGTVLMTDLRQLPAQLRLMGCVA